MNENQFMKPLAKIVLGKLGSEGRTRDLRNIALILRDAGAEVIYLGLRQTPESLIVAVEQEDADAVVCITSTHMAIELLENLQSAGGEMATTPVILVRTTASDTAGNTDARDATGEAEQLRRVGIAEVMNSSEVAAQVYRAVYGTEAADRHADNAEDDNARDASQATENMADLLRQARSGSNRAIGRLLSVLEDAREGKTSGDTASGDTAAELLLSAAASSSADARDASVSTYSVTATSSASGDSHVIGITGASGSGKSTLCSGLIKAASGRGRGRPKKSDVPAPKIAVLAVDPSSPRTGGAILGDRIRMTSSIQKPQSSVSGNVFFRSVAGQSGEIPSWIPDAVKLLRSVGFDLIVVETTGVGHVAEIVDTLVMVVTGDYGDDIQASKAGLLELADIFVVNKTDTQEAASVSRDLERMLDSRMESSWRPPVISTVATSGEGISDLWNMIEVLQIYRR